MLSRLLYFATTFAEAALSVFGLRGVYEQPRYTVRQTLQQVEIRAYAPRTAVETAVDGATPDQAARAAFQRLFEYITGANTARRDIAMTAPVEQGTQPGRTIAMTVPVQSGDTAGQPIMRFFLPRRVVRQGPPAPTDPLVHIVTLPETTIAALRFSGEPGPAARDRRTRQLLAVLAHSAWQPRGAPFLLTYDPPFTIATLRRNEVAVTVEPR